MAASASISEKSIHPQEGLKIQKKSSFSFSPTSSHRFGHNFVAVGRTTKWFVPSRSAHDSAPGDILVIDIVNGG